MTDIEQVVQEAKVAMAALTEFKSSIEPRLQKLDALDMEKQSKIMADIDVALKSSQELQLKQKAEIEALKTALSRPASGDETKAANEKAAMETKAAFDTFLKKGGKSDRHDFADYCREQKLELKALSINSDVDGGFLVPVQFGGIVESRIFESSPVRAYANVVQINSAALEIVLDNDEASAGWVGETASRPTTNSPTLDKRVIPVNELYANPKATQSFLDDAVVNAEAWLANKIASKLARLEATAFISGNGVAKPTGIITNTVASSAHNPSNVELVASGSSGAFTYDGISRLQSALKEAYQGNAIFMTKRANFGAIMLLKTGIASDNTPIFNMMYDKNVGIAASILGRPLVFADDIPAVAVDAKAMIYGDFKAGYTIVDRVGLRVIRDPFTDKPYVSFYTTKRVGGDVVTTEALKVLALT